MMDEENVFLVIQGIPRTFHELDAAEERAAELCAEDHKDYTIMLVPRARLEGALVARDEGVKLYAYEEVKWRDDDDR
jgi:hypothetical protein